MRWVVLMLLASCSYVGDYRPMAVATQGFSDDEVSIILQGANAWRVCGVDVQLEAPEVVTVVRDATLTGDGEQRGSYVYVRADLPVAQLATVVAHELGHYLSNSGEHVPGDRTGIMSSPAAPWRASGVYATDRAWMCERFGFCC